MTTHRPTRAVLTALTVAALTTTAAACTPTPTPTHTATATATVTPTPTPTPTASVTPSPTAPSSTPPPTPTPTVSTTPARTPNSTPTPRTLGPLTIRTRTLPAATKRAPYSAALVAVGGSGGYTWRRMKRSLPKGLTLTKSGTVTGTPRKTAKKRFRVRVTDSAGTRTTQWVRLRVR